MSRLRGELIKEEVSEELMDLLSDEDVSDEVLNALNDAGLAAIEGEADALFSNLGELRVLDIKRFLIDIADQAGSVVTTLFIFMGMFSILVGVLLIFLIFVMLAAARRSEMGMEAEVLEEEIDRAVAGIRAFYFLLIGFMALGLIVGIAGLGVISTRAVVERRQQIGVLRAIGYRRRMVQLSFLIESSFIALLGIAIGLLLGATLSYNAITDISTEEGIDTLRYSIPWGQVVTIMAIAYLFSIVATYLPARQASRTHPAEALRYE